jgi:hypothetical protein
MSRQASRQNVLARIRLSENFRDQFAMHVGQPEITALETICQLRVVETELMQDRRVQVVDMDPILRDVETEIVRLAHR